MLYYEHFYSLFTVHGRKNVIQCTKQYSKLNYNLRYSTKIIVYKDINGVYLFIYFFIHSFICIFIYLS